MDVYRTIDPIVAELDKDHIESIALMGSYSRGDAKPYSDVDIVCFVKPDSSRPDQSIRIIDNKYVVVSYVTPAEADEWFLHPDKATECIGGLRKAVILYDPNHRLKQWKEKAIRFQWTEDLQQKADDYCGEQMVGWLEEVHKALQGLLSDDIGRMLNGLFGLTYGMFKILRVKHGILLEGDNSFYQKVIEHFGAGSEIGKLSEIAFGIKTEANLRVRVIAGLGLFIETAEQVMKDLKEETHKQMILFVKNEVEKELPLLPENLA